jgi:flagellar protein FlaI
LRLRDQPEGLSREEPARGASSASVDSYNILDSPRVFIRIVRLSDDSFLYQVNEPSVDGFTRDLIAWLEERLLASPRLYGKISGGPLEDAIVVLLEEARRRALKLAKALKKRLPEGYDVEGAALVAAYYVARDYVGLGKLEPLARDAYVEDITCNGAGLPVYVYHSKYEWLRTTIVFSEDELERMVSVLGLRIGRSPTLARPVVEGVVKGLGYRVNIELDVVSRRGHTFTIRKPREVVLTVADLIRGGTLNPRLGAYLWLAVQYKQGMIIYGPTGSGKTTLVNALAMLVPPEFKIVTIEDTPEINLSFHENWVPLVTRPSSETGVEPVTLQSQVEAAMRQRPDLLILGEIRSREAYAFFQAVATGHGGLTTVHGDDSVSLARRLASPPMNVPLSMIASVKAFIKIARMVEEGKVVRRIARIDEVSGVDHSKGEVVFEEYARWSRGEWSISNRQSRLLSSISELYFIPMDELEDELFRRSLVLLYAAKKGMDHYSFQSLVRSYLRNHEDVVLRISREMGGIP